MGAGAIAGATWAVWAVWAAGTRGFAANCPAADDRPKTPNAPGDVAGAVR